MNFRHDLATIYKKKLHDLGVQTDANWSDHTLCVKFHDIKKRFFYSHQKYNVVYSDVLIKKISSLSLQESTTLQTIRYNLENQISILVDSRCASTGNSCSRQVRHLQDLF